MSQFIILEKSVTEYRFFLQHNYKWREIPIGYEKFVSLRKDSVEDIVIIEKESDELAYYRMDNRLIFNALSKIEEINCEDLKREDYFFAPPQNYKFQVFPIELFRYMVNDVITNFIYECCEENFRLKTSFKLQETDIEILSEYIIILEAILHIPYVNKTLIQEYIERGKELYERIKDFPFD
jgi:hypothetical protein